MPASRRRLTKVKRPDLDVRFWWAVLPDCGGQPVLPLVTQLGVVFIGIGSETAAMAMCSASCSSAILCRAAGCNPIPAQDTFAS